MVKKDQVISSVQLDPLRWHETVKKRWDLIQQNNSKRLISKLLDDLWEHFRKLSFGHHVQPRVKLHGPNEGASLVSEAKTITIISRRVGRGLTIGHVHESRIVSKITSMH